MWLLFFLLSMVIDSVKVVNKALNGFLGKAQGNMNGCTKNPLVEGVCEGCE